MFTNAGLERVLVSAAVFLSLFPSWRYRQVFFTASDLAFCLSLVAIMLTRGLPPAPFRELTPYWYAAFAILIGALGVSSLVNGVPERAIIVGSQYFFSIILLPLIIFGRDREATIALVKVFAVGLLVVGLASIILYYIGYSDDFRFVTGNGRLASFAESPNGHAQVIALACPLVLYLWLAGRMAVVYLVPLLVILLLNLALTSSNNGIAMTIVGVFAFFIALRDLRYLTRAAVGVAVCLGVILIWGSFWLPTTFEQRVLGAVRSGSIEEAGSFGERMALNAEALEMVSDTMLVGLGVDQYEEISRYGTTVHNTYLLLSTEGGLPALIGWVSLLLIATVGVPFFGRRHRLEAATAFAVAAMVVFIGFTTGHVYARQSVVPLWLALALVLAAIPSRVQPASIAATPPPPAAAGAALPPTARPMPPEARW
jgi:O-antigen ligase